jgi:hypothetical protein
MIHNHNPEIRDLVCLPIFISLISESLPSVGPSVSTTDDTSPFSEYAVWLENDVWSLLFGV